MAEQTGEVLVILKDSTAPGTRDQIAREGQLTQAGSERVFAMRGPVPDSPHIERVLTGADAEADVPAGLSLGESLFAKGWLLARKPKTRTGEGLPWDSPGFLPPDPKPQ